MKRGWLEVITGPMFSSKSDDLIHRLESAHRAGAKTVAFKPGKDTRTQSALVSRRNAERAFEAFTVESGKQILELVAEEHRVVGIDEVQFFGPDVVEAVRSLIDMSKRVIVAGLNTDFLFRPFNTQVMGSLMLLSEGHITFRTAVCVRCFEAATRSERLSRNEAQVMIGDREYIAVCRNCHQIELEPA